MNTDEITIKVKLPKAATASDIRRLRMVVDHRVARWERALIERREREGARK